MVDLMAKLFAVVGLDLSQPVTLQIIFPYLLRVCMAFLIVSGILGWIRGFSSSLMRGKL